jgi:hypothetical protein
MIEVDCVLCQTTEDEENVEDLNITTAVHKLVTNNAIITGLYNASCPEHC